MPDDLPDFEIPGGRQQYPELPPDPQTLKVPPRPPVTDLPPFQIPGLEQSRVLQTLAPQLSPPPAPQAPRPSAMPGMPAPGPAQVSPMAQLTKRILPQPPTPKYRDPLEALASPLTSLALLGSLFTRQPATTALKALGGAMKAQAEGDQVRYANEYQKYQLELGKAHEEAAEENAEYKRIYENRRMDLAERTARMRGVATRRGDSAMNAVLNGGGDPGPLLDGRTKAVAPITAAKAKAARIAEIRTEKGVSYVEAEALYKQEQQEAEMKAVAGTGQPNDPSLHGKAYLDTLPPTIADYIKGIADNRVMPPNTRTAKGQQTMQMVLRYKPDFRGQAYGGQAAAERNFSAGELRRNIRSANTLIGHMDRLDSNLDYLDTTDFRTANKALIQWARETGDTKIWPALTDIHFVAEEMSRALKGTATEGDINRGLALIDSSTSVPALKAAVREMVHLLETRTEEMKREAETTTGRTPEESEVLSPTSKQAITRLEGGGGPPGSKFSGYDPKTGKKVFEMPDGSHVVEQ